VAKSSNTINEALNEVKKALKELKHHSSQLKLHLLVHSKQGGYNGSHGHPPAITSLKSSHYSSS
jgi:hypothetical protein